MSKRRTFTSVLKSKIVIETLRKEKPLGSGV